MWLEKYIWVHQPQTGMLMNAFLIRGTKKNKKFVYSYQKKHIPPTCFSSTIPSTSINKISKQVQTDSFSKNTFYTLPYGL